MDAEGVPTTDTQSALGGLLMPLGGYKGSGLAMMAEILCGVLGGGAMSTELGGIRIQGQPMRTSSAASSSLAVGPWALVTATMQPRDVAAETEKNRSSPVNVRTTAELRRPGCCWAMRMHWPRAHIGPPVLPDGAAR